MKILVSLYDRATESFAPIMTVNTRAEAIRSLRDAMRDPQTPISRHPTDYELYYMGEYDDQEGVIRPGYELITRAEDHKE